MFPDSGNGYHRIMVPYEDLLGKQYGDYCDGPDRWNCWGIVREMHKRTGIILPDLNAIYRAQYEAQPRRDKLAAIVLREAERSWETVEEPAFGVTCVMRVENRATHMGYMLDRYRFIHSQEDTTVLGSTNIVVVHRLDSQQWQHKLESLHRWKA